MIPHATSVEAITRIACQINLCRTLNLAQSKHESLLESSPDSKKEVKKKKGEV